MKITFHDNKVNGQELQQDLQIVVQSFVEWEKDQKELRKHLPFNRLFLIFILDYEPQPGLKCYSTFSNETWQEIYREYKKAKI